MSVSDEPTCCFELGTTHFSKLYNRNVQTGARVFIGISLHLSIEKSFAMKSDFIIVNKYIVIVNQQFFLSFIRYITVLSSILGGDELVMSWFWRCRAGRRNCWFEIAVSGKLTASSRQTAAMVVKDCCSRKSLMKASMLSVSLMLRTPPSGSLCTRPSANQTRIMLRAIWYGNAQKSSEFVVVVTISKSINKPLPINVANSTTPIPTPTPTPTPTPHALLDQPHHRVHHQQPHLQGHQVPCHDSHIYHDHVQEFLYHRVLFHAPVHLVLLLP